VSAQERVQPEISRRRQVLADLALVVVTFIWGSTFVLVKDIVETVPPMLFLSVRFGIGAVALALLVTAMRRWRGLSMREVGWGSLTGLALGLGYVLQTVGLQYTTASRAGFITGLLVVLAPVMGIVVLRQMPGWWAFGGVLLATVGLLMLAVVDTGGVAGGLNEGDLIVLGCAFAFAVQVVLVAKVSRLYDPLRFTMLQVLVTGVLSALGALLFETPVAGLASDVWAGAAFLGIMATAMGIGVQVAVQSFTTVVHASLIYTLEPVFAAMFGYWLHGDRLGPAGVVGAGLIVVGMLAAELGPYVGRRSARRRATDERAAVEGGLEGKTQ
jgi:drug/metabolite transporter (DMT)-like permease